ncbi:hypothetical protein [Streptomyces sp. TP-A0356]|uniref:hypothetical protein n=1 Tax=Streptomyces sp. TP-A0356 TaxID=1359208 RepID=UPI0006E33EF8|nr:hypothetical protein [Streptomyces sp. TP-A0356]
MKKLMRRIAITGVSAAVAGGALLATGGSAMAAAPRMAKDAPARTPVVDTSHRFSPHRTSHKRIDPWVADQLAMFYPTAAKRQAMFDPWIKDQLAQFAPACG